MKKILMLIACASFGIALNAQTPTPPIPGTLDANQKTGEKQIVNFNNNNPLNALAFSGIHIISPKISGPYSAYSAL